MSTPVICFDFDGTLVDSQGRIHPRDVEILIAEVHVVWPGQVALGMARRFALETQPFTPASRDRQFTKLMCIAETFVLSATKDQSFREGASARARRQSYSLWLRRTHDRCSPTAAGC